MASSSDGRPAAFAGAPGPGALQHVSHDGCESVAFTAMASPCHVLVDTHDALEAERLFHVAEIEARRIEAKYSRYRDGNLVHRINHAGGAAVEVDEETADLLDFAATCWEVSEGRFDITSGALRRAWTFDGGSHVPTAEEIATAMEHVGWHRATWHRPRLRLPEGMEIDFGGIGKEYAVDRAASLMAARTPPAFLVNFGGDLFASGPRRDGQPWGVGIEDPDRPGEAARMMIELERGGIATSGDARRYVRYQGRRLGHILDPGTGWPIEDAPRSVTVLAGSCTEAGTFATLACLRGRGAGAFLAGEGVRHWIL